MLILHGWGDVQAQKEASLSIVKDTVRILATLMIRTDAQSQFLGRTIAPVISLVNLMTEPERMKGSGVDMQELVTNGLKILRLVTSEKDLALKISDEFQNCVYKVLDLVEIFGPVS